MAQDPILPSLPPQEPVMPDQNAIDGEPLPLEELEQSDVPESDAVPESEPEYEAESQPEAENGSDTDADDDEMYSVEEIEQLRANEVAFRWQASEYVHHHKSAQWYYGLGAVFVALVVIATISQYWIEIGLFSVMTLAIVVYARKPPRLLTYELTPKGISVEGRMHPYSQFRSFGVVPDIDWHTIDLDPVSRLSPRLAILFDEQDVEEIIGHLELHLPRVDRMPDLVERFSRYIRF